MQKICLLASALLIFLLSFNISFSPSSVSASSVNYELPYPGLLPDSPLYILRVIRDRIVGFLISDPLKKAEFNLLQADKRLNSGIYLFNKNKISMSISTISKAENYFEQALGSVREARKEGMDISEITEKLTTSSMKHREVLRSLEKRSPQNFKTDFESLDKRVAEFQKIVKSLTPKR